MHCVGHAKKEVLIGSVFSDLTGLRLRLGLSDSVPCKKLICRFVLYAVAILSACGLLTLAVTSRFGHCSTTRCKPFFLRDVCFT